MTPIELYQQVLTDKNFHSDDGQRNAVRAFDDLYHRIMQHQAHQQTFSYRLKHLFIKPEKLHAFIYGAVLAVVKHG